MRTILECCLYYKGEDECPYDIGNPNDYYKAIFWKYEWNCVHKFNNGYFGKKNAEDAFIEYISAAFEHWSNMHDAMDNGEYIKSIYFSQPRP